MEEQEFEHFGKIVRKNRAAYQIDGKRINVIGVDIKYFETNGDKNARYLAFRFVCGPGTTTEGPKYIITHHAFKQRAQLWEEPLQGRFVTIGQLMTKKGEAPCLEGCRAILQVALQVPGGAGWTRDRYIVEITQEAMRRKGWNDIINVGILFESYKAHYGVPMPYSFLVWICESMGGTVMSGLYQDVAPGSKSYALLCRQLGIRA